MSTVGVSRAGYVLVGGPSSRMGSDKALLCCRPANMPGVALEFLLRLLSAADANALTPTGPTGRPEPLCAVYPTHALTRLDHVFSRGESRIRLALASVHTVILPAEETGHRENVNTPPDWASLLLN